MRLAAERFQRRRPAAVAPWVAGRFLLAAAAARAAVYGGIEIGAKGVKATVLDVTGGADAYDVKVLMAGIEEHHAVGGPRRDGPLRPRRPQGHRRGRRRFADQMRKEHNVPDDRLYVVGSSGLFSAIEGKRRPSRRTRRRSPTRCRTPAA